MHDNPVTALTTLDRSLGHISYSLSAFYGVCIRCLQSGVWAGSNITCNTYIHSRYTGILRILCEIRGSHHCENMWPYCLPYTHLSSYQHIHLQTIPPSICIHSMAQRPGPHTCISQRRVNPAWPPTMYLPEAVGTSAARISQRATSRTSTKEEKIVGSGPSSTVCNHR